MSFSSAASASIQYSTVSCSCCSSDGCTSDWAPGLAPHFGKKVIPSFFPSKQSVCTSGEQWIMIAFNHHMMRWPQVAPSESLTVIKDRDLKKRSLIQPSPFWVSAGCSEKKKNQTDFLSMNNKQVSEHCNSSSCQQALGSGQLVKVSLWRFNDLFKPQDTFKCIY